MYCGALLCPSLDAKFQNYHTKCVWHMNGVLNLDEIKKLLAQFACKLPDESNEPN